MIMFNITIRHRFIPKLDLYWSVSCVNLFTLSKKVKGGGQTGGMFLY